MSVDTIVERERVVPDVPSISCRLCGSTELRSFLDLGATPPCELFLTAAASSEPEATYPLHVRVCSACLLAQIPPLITPEETFTEYAYFSSFSTSWVEHARRFVDGAVERLGLRPGLVRGRGGQQRRLPAAARRRARHPLPGHRAVGERRRGGPASKGVPTLTAFLTPETGTAGARASTARPTWSASTTSTPTSPTSSASPRACGRWSPTTAGCRSRCSTCSRWWSTPSSTPSTTSTSSTTRCSPASGRWPRAG